MGALTVYSKGAIVPTEEGILEAIRQTTNSPSTHSSDWELVGGGGDTERIDDADGKKAIDLTVPTFTGRTLYSTDGETKVMSWGNSDPGLVTAQFGIGFDWPASINMVDPADFSPSSDTAEARAMLFANYANLDALWLTPSASPPENAQEGMIYADTDHHLYYYNGTTWKQLDN